MKLDMLKSVFKADSNSFTYSEASTRESAMTKIDEISAAYTD